MGEMNGGQRTPRRIYLLAQPRTASFLLTRMLGLEKQPHVHWDMDKISVFTGTRRAITSLSHKSVDEWTLDEKMRVRDDFQQSFIALDQYLKAGESEGKIVFAKDHCNFMWNPAATCDGTNSIAGDPYFTVQTHSPDGTAEGAAMVKNPTILPTEYLGSWLPIFLIRHPALVFPSFCRGFVEVNATKNICHEESHVRKYLREQMSFSYTRCLHDWYTCYFREKADEDGSSPAVPILLDSSDIINDPSTVFQLAERLGLEPSKVELSWTPRAAGASADIIRQAFLRTLDSSSGVQKDRASFDPETIPSEEMKWREEFGDRLGGLIAECVRAAMPDYVYLRDKKFCAS